MPKLDTTRFGIRRGDEAAVIGLLVGFVVLRILSVRSTPLVYVDSADYRHVDLLGGGRRPFLVPLLYWLMPSDGWRVVEQAAISAVCWIALALVVAAGLRDRRVRLGAMAVILALGLTTQVTNWDSAILSDSFAISFTALVVAGWIAYRRRPSPQSIALVLAATVLWTFTRELHVYFTVAVAVVTFVAAVGRRSQRMLVALSIGLVVIAVVAVVEDGRNQETTYENIAGAIGLRIMPDAPARSWFEDAGMPDPKEFARGVSIPRETLQANPEFEHWLETRGLTTYARYLLTHPNVLITGPYGDLLEERETYAEKPSTNPVMLSPGEAYGRARPVLPPVVEDTLFDPGRTGAILTLTAFVLGAAARGRRDHRQVVPLVVIALVVPYLGLVWHGSVFEPGRHAMPGAVGLRVGVLALLAVLVDMRIEHRRAGTVREPIEARR